MKKSYFNLDEDAPLFNALTKMPQWWKCVLEDGDLYCNVRKDNRVNVYYRGASIMSLCFEDNKVNCEIHNYYLGYEKEICTLLGVKYGNVKSNPEDIVCRISTIKKRVEANKKFMACCDCDKKNGKKYSSEKFVQSQMYLNNKFYIDTEFALTLDDETTIRIDLAGLSEDGKICFEELKLVDDTRLRPSGGKRAEILNQMDSYDKFLKEAAKIKGEHFEPIIVEYYGKVARIMKKIGISRTDIIPSSVCDYVYLYIEQNYTKKHPSRDSAVKDIQDVCVGLHSNIEDVVLNYESL